MGVGKAQKHTLLKHAKPKPSRNPLCSIKKKMKKKRERDGSMANNFSAQCPQKYFFLGRCVVMSRGLLR